MSIIHNDPANTRSMRHAVGRITPAADLDTVAAKMYPEGAAMALCGRAIVGAEHIVDDSTTNCSYCRIKIEQVAR